MIDYKGFSNRLRILIDFHTHGNQSEFSRRSKVSQVNINKYLNGVSTPNLKQIVSILNYSKCSTEWLIKGVGSPFGKDNETRHPIYSWTPGLNIMDSPIIGHRHSFGNCMFLYLSRSSSPYQFNILLSFSAFLSYPDKINNSSRYLVPPYFGCPVSNGSCVYLYNDIFTEIQSPLFTIGDFLVKSAGIVSSISIIDTL